jgi:GGDEF domain-containing protein
MLIRPRGALGHRAERGHLRRDPDQYRNDLLAKLSLGKRVNFILETANGREISITSNRCQMAGESSPTKMSPSGNMARHDALTNLPNQRFFHEQMKFGLHTCREMSSLV